MRLPHTFCQRHIGEHRREARILGAAGINAEADRTGRLRHMTDTHLAEGHAVVGALDTKVVLTAAQPVPHRCDGSGDLGGRPVGVAAVGHDAAEVLYLSVLILDGGLEPIFAVEIHDDPALVEAVMTAAEIRANDKGKILFIRLSLQDRGVIVPETVVGALPQVGMRLRRYLDFIGCYRIIGRLSRPFHAVGQHTVISFICYAFFFDLSRKPGSGLPCFFQCTYSAVAVKSTSPEELIAVSMLSWITPIIKPTPTTCIEIASEIPNSEHAIGISSSEPPVTPELPQAASADRNESKIAAGKDTCIPSV